MLFNRTCLSLCLLFDCVAANAATLDPIFVTESRDAGEDGLPVNLSVITADDIERSTARTLPDLLAQQAGIAVRSLFGDASRVTVDLRGFGATGTQNTLVLLDGRRLNDIDLSEVDFAAIPLNNIERVEILRGSGSVLYGDGAAGGTINIITKRGTRSALHGGLTLAGGSYDTKQGDAHVSFGGEDFSANLFATRLESDNYRDNNDVEQTNGQADLRAYLGDEEFYLKFGSDNQDLRLPGVRKVDPGAGIDQLRHDRRGTDTPEDFADQDGKLGTLGWKHLFAGGSSLVVDGGIRHKNQQAFFDGGCAPFGFVCSNFVDTDLDTWSITPRLNLTEGLFGRPGSTTLGLDWYYSDYGSDRSQTSDAANIHRLTARGWSAAAYGQSTTEFAPGWDLTLGLRLQHVALKARDAFDSMAPGALFGSEAGPLSQDDTEHALEAGLKKRLGNAAVFARYTRSLRFATVDELFELNKTFVQVFSPLEPQTGDSFDTGVEYKHGRWSFQSDLYYAWFDNEIHFDPVTFSNVNLDPTRRYGAELSLAFQVLKSLRLNGSYTYTRAQFDEGPNDGADVPLVPKHLASIGADWQPLHWLTLSGNLRRVTQKRFDNDEANNFGELISAYTMLDMKLLMQFAQWRLTAAVDNLTDERALDYGVASNFTPGRFNAYPLPERSFTFSLGRDF